jgi:hypothetical protein
MFPLDGISTSKTGNAANSTSFNPIGSKSALSRHFSILRGEDFGLECVFSLSFLLADAISHSVSTKNSNCIEHQLHSHRQSVGCVTAQIVGHLQMLDSEISRSLFACS